jgi:anti-anti-sigma regulatory factor
VLKITTTQNESESITVHLCGQLTGEYVPELEKVLQPENSPRIALDMSNVTFVDRKAMEFLCGVKSRVSIENIPSYVTRWIEQEFRCGSSQQK